MAGAEMAWPQPNGRPGEWVTVDGELSFENGVFSTTIVGAFQWFAEEAYVIELGGESKRLITPLFDQFVARRGRLVRKLPRWNRKNQRLLAVDCAEHVLPIFEKQYPNDQRPRKAIEATRAFALGKLSDAEMAKAFEAAKESTGPHADSSRWGWEFPETALEDAARLKEQEPPWMVAAYAACACAGKDDVQAAAMAGTASARAAARASSVRASLTDKSEWKAAWNQAFDHERHWQADRLAWYLGRENLRLVPFGGDCLLCTAEPLTERLHEDADCWVADCMVCGVPMVVWRSHGLPESEEAEAPMLAHLDRIASERFGAEGYWIDDERRSIPDHWHVHARPASKLAGQGHLEALLGLSEPPGAIERVFEGSF
jgi:hypothetical protein